MYLSEMCACRSHVSTFCLRAHRLNVFDNGCDVFPCALYGARCRVSSGGLHHGCDAGGVMESARAAREPVVVREAHAYACSQVTRTAQQWRRSVHVGERILTVFRASNM